MEKSIGFNVLEETECHWALKDLGLTESAKKEMC
jgi:hypothetical protein